MKSNFKLIIKIVIEIYKLDICKERNLQMLKNLKLNLYKESFEESLEREKRLQKLRKLIFRTLPLQEV